MYELQTLVWPGLEQRCKPFVAWGPNGPASVMETTLKTLICQVPKILVTLVSHSNYLGPRVLDSSRKFLDS